MNLKDISNLISNVEHYKSLINYITQLDTSQSESLKEFFDSRLKGNTRDLIRSWNNINVHSINQNWSNTSGGWEGIGGSAMTNSYTTVIEVPWVGFACIYYDSRLAYICKINEKFDLKNLPGMSKCKQKLDIIYKKTNHVKSNT